jgi:hypothetical protein
MATKKVTPSITVDDIVKAASSWAVELEDYYKHLHARDYTASQAAEAKWIDKYNKLQQKTAAEGRILFEMVKKFNGVKKPKAVKKAA